MLSWLISALNDTCRPHTDPGSTGELYMHAHSIRKPCSIRSRIVLCLSTPGVPTKNVLVSASRGLGMHKVRGGAAPCTDRTAAPSGRSVRHRTSPAAPEGSCARSSRSSVPRQPAGAAHPPPLAGAAASRFLQLLAARVPPTAARHSLDVRSQGVAIAIALDATPFRVDMYSSLLRHTYRTGALGTCERFCRKISTHVYRPQYHSWTYELLIGPHLQAWHLLCRRHTGIGDDNVASGVCAVS